MQNISWLKTGIVANAVGWRFKTPGWRRAGDRGYWRHGASQTF